MLYWQTKNHQIKIPSSSHQRINKRLAICQMVSFSPPVAEELSPLLPKASSFQRFLKNSCTGSSTPLSWHYSWYTNMKDLPCWDTCVCTHTHAHPHLGSPFPAGNHPVPLLHKILSSGLYILTAHSLLSPLLPGCQLHASTQTHPLKVTSELHVTKWIGCFSVFISLELSPQDGEK